MTVLLFIAVVVLAVLLGRVSARVRTLEEQIARLRDAIPAPVRDERHNRDDPGPAVRAGDEEPSPAIPESPAAPLAARPAPAELPQESLAEEPAPEAPLLESRPAARAARPPIRLSFETIVGGKLPVWIGGAALVLSAFFLVRYSIESGLLGPGARSAIAGLFGMALVAASEAARRLPATRDDERIGQVLAGAGVASLYGTLYIAAQLYGLIGAGLAFALMIMVTAAALGLALRHGPPTAIMALIGGFAAPLLSSFDPGNIGPLLVYLGLLVSALFGLAIRRGWIWLAVAACGGGFAWVNILVAMVSGQALAGVGGFVLLLAIGATLALPRTGAARAWLRLLPMVAGLVQLLILAPALDFGPLAWGLYLLLGAAALWLGWRDDVLAPGGGAALALVLGLLGIALHAGEDVHAPWAAIAITLVFGSAGHLLARRSALWAGVALGATAGPVILVLALAHGLLSSAAWAGLLMLAALAAAALSWRARAEASATLPPSAGLAGGAAIAALLAMLAEAELIAEPWRWPAWLAIGVAIAGWSRRTHDRATRWLVPVPLALTAAAMAIELGRLGDYLGSIVLRDPTPGAADLIAIGLLPALLVAATGWLLTPGRLRTGLGWIALALSLAFVPALLPAPWHVPGLAAATAALILCRPAPRAWAVAAGLATIAFAGPLAGELLAMAGASLAGNRLPYLDLPPLVRILRELALPAGLIALALLRDPAPPGPWRRRAVAVLAIVATFTAYALAKAPLAIADLPRFERFGFLERVAITHACFAAAWIAARYRQDLARALLILGLARFVWFDLAMLCPALVPQSVGGIPLFNLATIDPLLVAFWLWPLRREPAWRGAMLAAILIAVAASVRQATHGAILTGPIGRTENWLYSAAFLALALAWLALGIRRRLDDLRILGLALLIPVTLKVFLIDAAVLEGLLRILSFFGLGIALIAISWAYRRFVAGQNPTT